MTFKEKLKTNIYNIPGWRTKRHILVIESDDWGSIRMPSRAVYDELRNKGVRFAGYGYDEYDTLASRDDPQCLFDVCQSVRDIRKRPVVITANCVMANPEFAKIKASGYNEYYYEPFTETLAKYYPNSNPFTLWFDGINNSLFCPQLHGREHVNVQMWLNSLRENHGGARVAFEKGVYSIVVSKEEDVRQRNTTAFRYLSEDEKTFYRQSIMEAQQMFEKLFRHKSESFIAPAFSWDEDIERWLSEVGVRYIQGVSMHFYQGKRRFHAVGEKNGNGQHFLIRNASWEPTQNQGKDNNGECLRQIATAFRWGKPATISAHRLNFIGGIDKKNRDINLRCFAELLKRIQKEWPDVEFMSTPELGELISNYEQHFNHQ